SHIIVVTFAVISVIGFIAYLFQGIGKFCTSILPWDLTLTLSEMTISSEKMYALIICILTTLYTIKGDMYSVVATEVAQFVIMTISALMVAFIGYTSVTSDQINAVIPEGWANLWFGWNLELDWGATPYPAVYEKRKSDGFEWFGLRFVLFLFEGGFASLVWPVAFCYVRSVLC